MGYSFRLTARVLLYAPSHRQDSTYHGLCYTSRGALAGTRNSSMGPPHEGSIRRPIALWANALTMELHLAPPTSKNHQFRYEAFASMFLRPCLYILVLMLWTWLYLDIRPSLVYIILVVVEILTLFLSSSYLLRHSWQLAIQRSRSPGNTSKYTWNTHIANDF